MKLKVVISWLLRILAALIMLQTLYFKFSAAPESIYIFSTLGIEPWGRIATGIAELVASVLLLWPRTVSLGAVMGIGIMAGASISHFAVLGIVVKDDGGYLFYLCLTVMICCIVLVIQYKSQLIDFVKMLTHKKTQQAASQ